MSRPLSLLLAAALAASTVAVSTIPASAETSRSGEWNTEHWRGDFDGNWRWGHRRHHHPGFSVGGPGFSFSFGVPYPPRYSYYRPRERDCYREWDGSLYCRAY